MLFRVIKNLFSPVRQQIGGENGLEYKFISTNQEPQNFSSTFTQCIFCIVTTSHLASAHVFYESLVSCSDLDELGFDFFIFLLGSKSSSFEKLSDRIRYVLVDEVFESEFLLKLANNYTPAEFCWVLKPFISSWLLMSYQLLFYFDSDICFFDSIDCVCHEMMDADILLTPHYLLPFGCKTSFGVRALSLLRGGIFNAGFLGLRKSEQTLSFLKWWQVHVSRHGRNEPDNGMCGDQRWLDLVPVLFEQAKICRHPGMNVGYWNIHERQIDKNQYGFQVFGYPLVFMHLSAFNEKNALSFSDHLLSFKADGALAEILDAYSLLLRNHKNKCNFINSEYIYYRWWHKHVRLYRWFLSFFHNPRSCL
jgi:hypothetical protein